MASDLATRRPLRSRRGVAATLALGLALSGCAADPTSPSSDHAGVVNPEDDGTHVPSLLGLTVHVGIRGVVVDEGVNELTGLPVVRFRVDEVTYTAPPSFVVGAGFGSPTAPSPGEVVEVATRPHYVLSEVAGGGNELFVSTSRSLEGDLNDSFPWVIALAFDRAGGLVTPANPDLLLAEIDAGRLGPGESDRDALVALLEELPVRRSASDDDPLLNADVLGPRAKALRDLVAGQASGIADSFAEPVSAQPLFEHDPASAMDDALTVALLVDDLPADVTHVSMALGGTWAGYFVRDERTDWVEVRFRVPRARIGELAEIEPELLLWTATPAEAFREGEAPSEARPVSDRRLIAGWVDVTLPGGGETLWGVVSADPGVSAQLGLSRRVFREELASRAERGELG